MFLIKKEDFGYRPIGEIKPSDAQRWFIKLHKDGKGYSTLTSVRGVLKPAFQMAYEEDIIRRNPFDFVITKYVPNDSKHREALTDLEQKTCTDGIRKGKKVQTGRGDADHKARLRRLSSRNRPQHRLQATFVRMDPSAGTVPAPERIVTS